jgi:hypothetical protein
VAVENGHLSSAVADQLPSLQRLRGVSDASASYTQHVREEILRKIELIRMGSIARHQQPAREASLDDMEARTRGQLRELTHEYIEVAHQGLSQDGATPERAGEFCRFDTQGSPGALYQRSQGSLVHPHQQRNSEHALVADEAHL